MRLNRYSEPNWSKTFKTQADLIIYLRGCICHECYTTNVEPWDKLLNPAKCTISDLLDTACGEDYYITFEE